MKVISERNLDFRRFLQCSSLCMMTSWSVETSCTC